MTIDDARALMKRLFIAYPSYRRWLEETDSPQETLQCWLETLAACDMADVSDVVDEIISGDLEGISRYEKPDSLARNIRREANERRGKRTARATQFKKYLAKDSSGAWNIVSKSKTGRVAVTLGEMVKAGEITKEVNDRRMFELDVWDKGGPEPAWMSDLIGKERLA